MLKYEDNLTDDELDYLHGSCQLWALKHGTQNDSYFVITEYDYDIDGEALLHCGIYRNGKYIDVRGDTDNLEEILFPFDYGEYEVSILSYYEFIDILNDFDISLTENASLYSRICRDINNIINEVF